MHYLKLDPLFSLTGLKPSSCSCSLLYSFMTCPLEVSLAYFFEASQRMATRRQTWGKIERDSGLLITPHLHVQSLQ